MSKTQKTSSENVSKKRKTNSYERVQRVEGFKGNCQQIIRIIMWWKQIGMTSGEKK